MPTPAPLTPGSDEETKLMGLFATVDQGDIEQVAELLVAAGKAYEYESWVTAKPPRESTRPMPAPLGDVELTPVLTMNSLELFVTDMLSRGWDTSKAIWYVKRDDSAIPRHDHEFVIHPELIGIKVPPLIVHHMVCRAQVKLHQEILDAQAASDLQNPLRTAIAASMAKSLSILAEDPIGPELQTSLQTAFGQKSLAASDDQAPGVNAPGA